MGELLSVGLDVGTTTTQMVVSRLVTENRASAYTVPRMEITGREVMYQSPIYFTPLLGEDRIDGEGIRRIVEAEYAAAGITPELVDTGAVIITGETSRKENAEAVVHALSRMAGDFVVATAGPDLESVLAAKGAGAVEASRKGAVLHMDIGGGTSNLALCVDGKVAATGCLNVGGRLLKFDENGEVTYVSPVLRKASQSGQAGCNIGSAAVPLPALRATLSPGEGMEDAWEIARFLASLLEMAAGRREKTEDYYRFLTPGTVDLPVPEGVTVSFSGGVADCIEKDVPPFRYGDLGPLLGRAIRESSLCQMPYRLGSHTIRATVIGAGCHSVQLSGSTIFLRGAALPVKNLPVAVITKQEQEAENLREIIGKKLAVQDTPGALFLPGWVSPPYSRVTALAEALKEARCPIVLEADMAKVLGNALALRRSPEERILCIDGLHIPEGSYLDIGAPVGSSVTAVVKTLAFEK